LKKNPILVMAHIFVINKWPLERKLQFPTKVVFLDFSNTDLREFPHEVLQLVKLRRLDLSHNHLRTLPSTCPSTLQYVNLENNELTNIPQEWLLLENLCAFFAQYNPLIALPDLSQCRAALISLSLKKIVDAVTLPGHNISWSILHNEKLGTGGQGSVFKTAASNVAAKKNHVESLLLEAKALATCNHPSIPAFISFLPDDNILYFERVHGVALKDLLNFNSTIAMKMHVLCQLASALFHLHSHGISHCDFSFAHNVSINPTTLTIYLFDMGRASMHGNVNDSFEKLDVLRFGIFCLHLDKHCGGGAPRGLHDCRDILHTEFDFSAVSNALLCGEFECSFSPTVNRIVCNCFRISNARPSFESITRTIVMELYALMQDTCNFSDARLNTSACYFDHLPVLDVTKQVTEEELVAEGLSPRSAKLLKDGPFEC